MYKYIQTHTHMCAHACMCICMYIDTCTYRYVDTFLACVRIEGVRTGFLAVCGFRPSKRSLFGFGVQGLGVCFLMSIRDLFVARGPSTCLRFIFRATLGFRRLRNRKNFQHNEAEDSAGRNDGLKRF